MDEKNGFQKLTGHLHTVFNHKRHVAYACFKMGLIRQGIFHDMSKFSPSEFIPSVKYYDGTHSPTVEERKDKGCSACWMHHKGRNKHHYEYWSDYPVVKSSGVLFPCRMPLKYVAEMVADRYAACVAYQGKDYTSGSAWTYFSRNLKTIQMETETKILLSAALIKMRDEGENAAFSFMRDMMKITKGADYDAETLGIPRSIIEQ